MVFYCPIYKVKVNFVNYDSAIRSFNSQYPQIREDVCYLNYLKKTQE